MTDRMREMVPMNIVINPAIKFGVFTFCLPKFGVTL